MSISVFEIPGTKLGNKLYKTSDGYLFKKDKATKDGGLYLKCRGYHEGCRAYGIKQGDELNLTREHNHDPHIEEIKCLELKTKLKLAAEESDETLRGVFDRVYGEESNDKPVLSYERFAPTMRKRRSLAAMSGAEPPDIRKRSRVYTEEASLERYETAEAEMEDELGPAAVLIGPRIGTELYRTERGYIYRKGKLGEDGRLYLKCRRCHGNFIKFCPATAVLNTHNYIERVGHAHNHSGEDEEEYFQALLVKTRLKMLALERPNDDLHAILSTLTDDERSMIGSEDAMLHALRRCRRKVPRDVDPMEFVEALNHQFRTSSEPQAPRNPPAPRKPREPVARKSREPVARNSRSPYTRKSRAAEEPKEEIEQHSETPLPTLNVEEDSEVVSETQPEMKSEVRSPKKAKRSRKSENHVSTEPRSKGKSTMCQFEVAIQHDEDVKPLMYIIQKEIPSPKPQVVVVPSTRIFRK